MARGVDGHQPSPFIQTVKRVGQEKEELLGDREETGTLRVDNSKLIDAALFVEKSRFEMLVEKGL